MKHILRSLFAILCFTAIATAQYTYVPFAMSVDSVIRPANATAYAVGDALNDSLSTSAKVLVFELTGVAGAFGEITNLYVMSDSSNIKSLRLHFYDDSTAIERTADNSALSFSSANGRFTKKLGYIDIDVFSNVAASAGYGEATFSGIVFRFATSTKKFYAVTEVRAAFTPKSNEKYLFGVRGYVR